MTRVRRPLLLALVAVIVATVVLAQAWLRDALPANPCVEPLPWRVGSVDPRFGLSPAEMEAAVRAAIAVWEEPTARTLFRHDPEDGMPVDLVYDHRQAELEAREELESRLNTLRDSTLRLKDEYARKAARVTALVRTHNQGVDAWNRAGGGTEAQRVRLEAERRRIDDLQADLARTGAELQGVIDGYNALFQRADTRVRRVQAGNFEETVREVGGHRIRTSARLTIYQFEDRVDLIRILAHELGHGLGLTHVADPRALMFAEYAADRAGMPALAPADIEALIARCEGLAFRSHPGRPFGPPIRGD